MSYETHIARAALDLQAARNLIMDEMRDYPTPVSGCDAQYNHLVGMRNALSAALDALSAPQFVATPRTPEQGAGIESR